MKTLQFRVPQILSFLLLSSVSLSAQVTAATDTSSSTTHGPVVTKALLDCRLKTTKFNKQGALNKEEASWSIDNFFNAYDRATTDAQVISQQNEQGAKVSMPDGLIEMQHVQIRFAELYPDLSDDALFPLTNSNIVYAPESTFAGLIAYDSHGKQEARLIGKAKKWRSGVTNAGGQVTVGSSYYVTVLVNDAHETASTPVHIIYAKWRDLKGKIAFDATAEKIAQDHQEEVDALTRQQ